MTYPIGSVVSFEETLFGWSNNKGKGKIISTGEPDGLRDYLYCLEIYEIQRSSDGEDWSKYVNMNNYGVLGAEIKEVISE